MGADIVLGTILMWKEYRKIVFLFDFRTFEPIVDIFGRGTLGQFWTVTIAATLAPVESRRTVLLQFVALVGADIVLGTICVWEIDLMVGVVHFRAVGGGLRSRHWGRGVRGRWRG